MSCSEDEGGSECQNQAEKYIPVCTAMTTAKAKLVTLRKGAGLDDISGSQVRWFKQFQSCSLYKCGSREPGSTDVGPLENL